MSPTVSDPAPPPETVLERALANGGAPGVTPLDVLEAARTAWLEKGRLDMGALAVRLGLSRATLYRWVGSKERLLGEVLWSFAEPAFEQALRETRGSGADYVSRMVERYLRAAVDFRPLRRFIDHDPEYALKVMASKYSSVQRRSVAALRGVLEDQVRAGHLEPVLDPDSLAYLIVRIGESFMFSDIISGGEPDVEKACEAIDALLHAPRARSRGRRARP